MSQEIRVAFIVLIALLHSYSSTGQQKYALNPYATVDWNSIEFLHSFSHSHREEGRDEDFFWDMGFRHFPFSNYYPSRPRRLSDNFRKKHPDALWAPNAEQVYAHGVGHFNTLGSYYTTGYSDHAKTDGGTRFFAPGEYTFSGLNIFNPGKASWRGVYMLWIRSPPKVNTEAYLTLTVDDAKEINDITFHPVGDGIIKDRQILAKKSRTILYLKAESESVKVKFDFNPDETEYLWLAIMQGVHRPWQDAFHAALDGKKKDEAGNRIEGLIYADGGGITLNHPWIKAGESPEPFIEKLNFDPRILGIEVWNAHSAFGDELAYYKLWDDILRTGTRCFGFFVKDHKDKKRGRNVLLIPKSIELRRQEREHNALRAYRQGCFFGLLGALSVNEAGNAISPYDYSRFRFTNISVKKDKQGNPEAVEVSVAGQDMEKRPNVQIRFITEKGVSLKEDGNHAIYKLQRNETDAVKNKYVRMEAFAYPNTHMRGCALKSEHISAMNVLEISKIQDNPGAPIVDMIFSQPILFGQ